MFNFGCRCCSCRHCAAGFITKAVDEHSLRAINASHPTEASPRYAARHTVCVRRVGFLVTPAGNLSTANAGCVRRSIFPVDIQAHPDRSSSIPDWSQSVPKGCFFQLRRPIRPPANDLWQSMRLLPPAVQRDWGVPALQGARALGLPPLLQGICSRRAQHFWIFGGGESPTYRFHNTFPFPCFKTSFFLPFCEMAFRHPFRNSHVVKSMLRH